MKNYLLAFVILLFNANALDAQVLNAKGTTLVEVGIGVSKMGRLGKYPPASGADCYGGFNGGISQAAVLGMQRYFMRQGNSIVRWGFDLKGSYFGFNYAKNKIAEGVVQSCSGIGYSNIKIEEDSRANALIAFGPVIGLNTKAGLVSITGHIGYSLAVESGYTFEADTNYNTHFTDYQHFTIAKGGLCTLVGLQYTLLVNKLGKSCFRIGADYTNTSSSYDVEEKNSSSGPYDVKLYGFQAYLSYCLKL